MTIKYPIRPAEMSGRVLRILQDSDECEDGNCWVDLEEYCEKHDVEFMQFVETTGYVIFRRVISGDFYQSTIPVRGVIRVTKDIHGKIVILPEWAFPQPPRSVWNGDHWEHNHELDLD